MTTHKFAPKDAEVIRQEAIDKYGLDETDDYEAIEKIVADRLKDEQFKASLHEDKKKHLKAKEYYKQKMVEAGFDPKTGEKLPPKGKSEEKTKETNNLNDEQKIRQIVAEERFIESGGSNTELRQIKKIMSATGKTFTEAQKDSLFIAFQEKQEREQKSRSAQLPPSRGGSYAPKTEEDEMAKKFDRDLPPGFDSKTK